MSLFPKTFLNPVPHQYLRPLLVFTQHIVGGGDLVALQSVQECYTDHSTCVYKTEPKTNTQRLLETNTMNHVGKRTLYPG